MPLFENACFLAENKLNVFKSADIHDHDDAGVQSQKRFDSP